MLPNKNKLNNNLIEQAGGGNNFIDFQRMRFQTKPCNTLYVKNAMVHTRHISQVNLVIAQVVS